MRSLRIPASKTISIAELDDDVVLILAAGVQLTLPRPSGDRRLYVRAEGAGASVICSAGIEIGGGVTATDAIDLSVGETLHLVAYYDAAAGTHSAYLALGAVAGQLAALGYHAPVRLMSAAALPCMPGMANPCSTCHMIDQAWKPTLSIHRAVNWNVGIGRNPAS